MSFRRPRLPEGPGKWEACSLSSLGRGLRALCLCPRSALGPWEQGPRVPLPSRFCFVLLLLFCLQSQTEADSQSHQVRTLQILATSVSGPTSYRMGCHHPFFSLPYSHIPVSLLWDHPARAPASPLQPHPPPPLSPSPQRSRRTHG